VNLDNKEVDKDRRLDVNDDGFDVRSVITGIFMVFVEIVMISSPRVPMISGSDWFN
jgi:hypothetical protein